MKTSFFILSHLLPPKQCCKTLRGCVFSNIEEGGRRGYLSREEREEFTPRKKVGNFHVSATFVHDCWFKNL